MVAVYLLAPCHSADVESVLRLRMHKTLQSCVLALKGVTNADFPFPNQGEAPQNKRLKGDNPVRPKLVDVSGKGIPIDLSAFKDDALATHLLWVNILSQYYDYSKKLSAVDRRELLARHRYKAQCLEVAERDYLELEATHAARFKQEVEEAATAKEALEKEKIDAAKLAADTELARAALADELDKLKVEHADLQKTSAAAALEHDRLNGVVSELTGEKAELLDANMLAESTIEAKDIYLGHLAFLLEPHLGLLPAAVADEIKGMPEFLVLRLSPRSMNLVRMLLQMLRLKMASRGS